MRAEESAMGKVFYALCKAIDTPLSLGCWLRYKYSHTELVSLDVNPRGYTNAADFHIDYSVVSYLKKFEDLNTGIDLKKVALQSFTTSESNCKETNGRFRHIATVKNSRLSSILYGAQRKIAMLLGCFSLFCVNGSYGWGPGATRDLTRARAFVDTKMSELPITVSRTCLGQLKSEIEQDLHWSSVILGCQPEGSYSLLDRNFLLVDSCKITTVPKNAKTDRVIAVEPRGNGFLQKGFGAFIRQRLRKVGIDLDNQGDNQFYASRAHKLGLATLDLRAASDTLSTGLVYHLLPYDWASAMDACRSRMAVMPDKSEIVLEKFSSMGNGFTFELETLVFWAIAQSTADYFGSKGVVSVYGDDIIVPSVIATDVSLALQFCGFSLNDEKSFFEGPFFESCGRHYFNGVDVTPAYQKEPLISDLSHIRCGNRLIRLAFRLGQQRRLDIRIKPAWLSVQRMAEQVHPGVSQFQLPFGSEGDDGWLQPYRSFDFKGIRISSSHGIRCRVLSTVHRKLPACDAALLAWSYRRGVVTSSPFLGEVSITRTSQVRPTYRKVIPYGRFSVTWDR